MTAPALSPSLRPLPTWRWEVGGLILLVAAFYGARLTALPICGEEPRWACGAVQMLETGDWIVPRQQGTIFPERPPMSSWAMAIAARCRGSLDDAAVRLPSVLATLLTTLVVYGYTQEWLGRRGGFLAAGMFATFGQVLQLGRMGESESLFTLFVSSSLLVWHWAYQRGWSGLRLWTVGYSLVAMGALVKGIQAPVYFAVVTTLYLLLERRMRLWLSWSHLAGLATFLAMIGVWQIPFLRATSWDDMYAIWFGLVQDRVGWQGLMKHMATYPVETFVCLLPWSPLALLAIDPQVRQTLARHRPWILFLALSLMTTYPSVWWVAGARGRYYMPLYPCVAVLLAALWDAAVATAAGSRAWRVLTHLGRTFCVAASVITLALVLVAFWPGPEVARIRQPAGFTVVFALLSLGTVALVIWNGRRINADRTYLSAVAVMTFVGVAYVGLVINIQARTWNHPRPAVLAVRGQLPEPAGLVSLGPVDHRFVYFFGETIPELAWPKSQDELPQGITYFCFDRHRGDTAEVRLNGRGRQWSTTSGTLPFAWEEVAIVDCERRLRNPPHGVVVIGRVIPQVADRAAPLPR